MLNTPLLLSFLLCMQGFSSGSATSAAAMLQQAKQATGGTAWDRIGLLHYRSRLAIAGMTGTVDSWTDLLRMRYVTHYTMGPDQGAEGFTSTKAWRQDSSGQVRMVEISTALEGSRNEAYRRARGYFFPDRWPARIEGCTEKESGGRKYFAVSITPEGGRTFEVWIEQSSNRIERMVEPTPTGTSTEQYTDYRDVAGVKLPFQVISIEDSLEQRETLLSAIPNPPGTPESFEVPAQAKPDYQIGHGKVSIVLPFELVDGHIFLNVKLNDAGPFRFELDTGSFNVMTPEVAHKLSLVPQGALPTSGTGEQQSAGGLVKVNTVELAGLELFQQLFTVIDFDFVNRERGSEFDGTIGYDLFSRLVVRIDYDNNLLTLTEPRVFLYSGPGVAVPFYFHDRTPLVSGELDGVAGDFTIDTGSGKTLDISRWFWERNRLKSKYNPKYSRITGAGLGGLNRGMPVRACSFRMASAKVQSPVVELSEQRSGTYSDTAVAGNIGYGILSRFNLTFDYSRQEIYFERNRNYGQPDPYDRSGLTFITASDGFEILDVVPESPAASAGLVVGDRIVGVDGKPAVQLTRAEMRAKLRAAPGTSVQLSLEGPEGRRDRTVILAELF
jgi:hypothetical protein